MLFANKMFLIKKIQVQSWNVPPSLDSTAASIFVGILVELTNTVFVNSTNINTNIETAALSKKYLVVSLTIE